MFCSGFDQDQSAEKIGLSVRSVNAIFLRIRRRIVDELVLLRDEPESMAAEWWFETRLRLNLEVSDWALREFQDFAGQRLLKFNGVPKHTYVLHMRETEYRFRNRGSNLQRVLLNLFRKTPL